MTARAIHRLTALKIANLTKPGKYADGGGLYLIIGESRRRWVYRYSWRGARCELGLGGAGILSLAKARERAAECRALIAEGKNPKAERDRAERNVTFGTYADAFFETMSATFRNEKHVAQWKMTLTVYAAPLRKMILEEIGTPEILRVLKPHWSRVPETANRLRGRIESVLNAAKAEGLRDGENPARWRGHLDQLLPRRRKGLRGHHAALPFAKIKVFIRKLRAREGTAARALEFLILTAARTNEIVAAQWDEIDLLQKVWIVPAERMKSEREHRVPLSTPALCLLKATPEEQRVGLIFKTVARDKPLSNMAMPMLLRRMGRPETVHGFRSTFRDWASETTNIPNEVCEMALAHVIAGKTEAAYRRGDLFMKRRKLMKKWAKYCGYDVATDSS
ncbi:tyrosine-type recombinase/integrase [Sphingomonas immobilis]|uniref:Integrase arm-type DNA-binding domain-containing protein n=1 Tax=Sphingomonas immobilis TaxID=3063997 RepID=A0ABT8ZWN5_9SPHN|nr:site-specific integrase [Sphingomonas sp. CA1-15]MDO7841963.1 integrase arm-type DNA-binding domain-containing protein [Sphingomonas sp. CA1-15]